MTKPKLYNEIINFKLDTPTLAMLKSIAAAWGVNMSAAVRMLIIERYSELKATGK